jgi:hypothetical protein
MQNRRRRFLLKQRYALLVLFRPLNWTHPEPLSVPVRQFLAMTRFDKRK